MIPCPKCGSQDIEVIEQFSGHCYVSCKNCWYRTDRKNNRKSAVAEWNMAKRWFD